MWNLKRFGVSLGKWRAGYKYKLLSACANYLHESVKFDLKSPKDRFIHETSLFHASHQARKSVKNTSLFHDVSALSSLVQASTWKYRGHFTKRRERATDKDTQTFHIYRRAQDLKFRPRLRCEPESLQSTWLFWFRILFILLNSDPVLDLDLNFLKIPQTG